MAKALVSKASNVTDAVIRKHIKAVTEAKDELESAQGIYRGKLKAAKTDGVNTKELIAALAAKKREPEEVALDMKAHIRYLALLNMPMTQQDLFGIAAKDDEPEEPEDDDEHARWEAQREGAQSGASGHGADANRYTPGTALHQAWYSGWAKEQEKLARGVGGVKRASTRRQRSPSGPAVN